VALVIVLLLVLGIKSCRDSARRDAFKNYVRDVAALVQGSDSESRNLFALLQRPGAQGQVQLQNAVNGYESDASQLVDRAKGTSHPDELSTANRYFVQVMELRRDGIANIAQQLRTALSGQGKQDGVSRIATQMQLFLASDVLYSQRFLPNLDRPLKKEGLLDQVQVPRSRFLPDLQWVRPTVVARSLQGLGTAAGPSGPIAPGLHGTSLLGVTARPVDINGQPGAMFVDPAGHLTNVFVLDIADWQVQTVRSVINPSNLRHLGPLADMADLRRQRHSH